MQGRFRGLSALYGKRGKADTLVQLRVRGADDAALAERLLRSEGYYDGKVDVSIGAADAQGRVAVTLTATPGAQYRFGDVKISGPATVPPGMARNALKLASGQPIIAPAVEAAEADVALRLPERGYPFVKLRTRDVVLDDATHLGDYTLPVEPGPRSSFGGVLVAGYPVLKPDHVAVIARFRRGQLYDSRMVDDLRRALVATSLYSSIGIEPVDTGKQAPDGTEAVDLKVTGSKAPDRTLAFSAGYETGLGVSLEGSWTHRNLFPPEGALIFRAITGTQQQLLGVTFSRSDIGQRDRTFQAQAQISRETLDAYDANTISLGVRLSRDSTPIWQKLWTYSAGANVSVSQETGYDLSAAQTVTRTYEVAALPLKLAYDRSDSLLDPTRGFRLTVQPSPEVSFGDGTQPYLKTIVEGSAYYPLAQSFVLAGRLRFGALYGANSQDIAPSRRFYSGGGGSVRGFGYQELGPKDPDAKPVGGSSLTEFSVEGRYRFGDYGVVGFLDGGQVYERSTPGLSDLRYGVGVGGRLYTNFGPMRFDVATPLDRRAGESLISIYISIGQAF